MRRRPAAIAILAFALVLALTASAVLAAPQAIPTTQDDGQDTGLVIIRVDREGPAAAAGIVRGDILLAIEDQPLNSTADLLQALQDREPGDRVELSVLHGDDTRTIRVTLDDRDGMPYLGVVPSAGMFHEDMPMALPAMEVLQAGAVITEVVEDSPAAAAGLQVGDAITAVDGATLDLGADLADVIGGYEPGDIIAVEITRPGEDSPLELEVELAEHPDRAGAAFLGVAYQDSYLGAMRGGRLSQLLEDLDLDELEGLDPESLPHWQFRRYHMPFDGQGLFRGFPFHFQLPQDDMELLEGAVVQQVVGDSPAEAAGLEAGDVITALDDQPITGPEDLVDAIRGLQAGEFVTLTVQRAGEDETQEIVVTLRENEDGQAFLGVLVGALMMQADEYQLDPSGTDRMRPMQRFRLPQLREMLREGQLPFNLEDLPVPVLPWLDQAPSDLSPGWEADNV